MVELAIQVELILRRTNMSEDTHPSDPTNGMEEEPQVFAVNLQANQVKLNRRDFLELSAAAVATTMLTGCNITPTPGVSPTAVVPEPTSTTKECIVNFPNAPLFNGPGTNYTRVRMLKQNDTLRILGRVSDGNWLEVSTSSGDIGWVSSSFVDLKIQLADIPIESNIPSITPENTATSEPTLTPTTTLTPEPTQTSTPQPTPTPLSIGSVNVSTANVRIAPIANIEPIINLQQGEQVKILGRSDDGSWVLVDTGKSTSETKRELIGWMKANQLTITPLKVADIPVVTPLPTPTPLPGSLSDIPPGSTGIKYDYKDEWGIVHTYTLSCGSSIPPGAVCTCNCITVPTATPRPSSPCSCHAIHYWYPN
jgi:hypothetical protein